MYLLLIKLEPLLVSGEGLKAAEEHTEFVEVLFECIAGVNLLTDPLTAS